MTYKYRLYVLLSCNMIQILFVLQNVIPAIHIRVKMEELVVILQEVTHAAARYLISSATANVSIAILYTLNTC